MQTREFWLLLFILGVTGSCRSTRNTVEVMENNAPSNPPSSDYLQVDGSVQTSLTISAISLPTQRHDYERLDLALKLTGSVTETVHEQDYKIGEPINIDAHQSYDIVIGAYMGMAEVYSTRFCNQRQSFRAIEGSNTYTASLCSRP